ncbi:MAG: signal peptidase I [Elusimicrobiota bacterium]
MEAKLFWISMACGGYALLLRRFCRREERLADWLPTAFMHGLFCLLVGAAAGSLSTSYWERPEWSWRLMAGLGAAGFLLGFLWRAFRDGRPRVSKGLFYLPVGAAAGFFLQVYVKRPDLAIPLIAGLAAAGFIAGLLIPPPPFRKPEENSWDVLREDVEWADTGFSAILLAAFIMYFFVQAFKIPSGSMRHTLLEGDHLFVNKLIYGVRIPLTEKRVWRFREVSRGDIVVFRFPTKEKENPHYGKDFIKRAVGLPGDVVEIRDKRLYVNGRPRDEAYAHHADDMTAPPAPLDPAAFQNQWEAGRLARVSGEFVRDNFGPVTVPPGHYMVLGDNRDQSFDSRFWGPLPDENLKGRAWFLYLPLKRMKVIR